MAYRFVRAKPKRDRMPELRERLDSGDIKQLEPFGAAMTKALQNIRFDLETGEAVWVEEDYYTPSLAMERAEVLDDYFEGLTILDENIPALGPPEDLLDTFRERHTELMEQGVEDASYVDAHD